MCYQLFWLHQDGLQASGISRFYWSIHQGSIDIDLLVGSQADVCEVTVQVCVHGVIQFHA